MILLLLLATIFYNLYTPPNSFLSDFVFFYFSSYVYKRCIERATTVEAVGGLGYGGKIDPATSI
jgi:hypothetical protein